MKVAFFLNNVLYRSDTDYSNIQHGNPGIGGSEYMLLLIAYYLSYRSNGLYIRLYVTNDGLFNDVLKIKKVENIEIAANDAANDGFDKFVFDSKWAKWQQKPFKHLPSSFSLIPWMHSFCLSPEAHIIYDHPNVRRIVCVGSEQRDLFRDDRFFKKSDYIFNCVPINEEVINVARGLPNCKREHNVVFMGSLNPIKTFHVLAEIWPRILERVSDAQLYVIGSAELYNKINEYGAYHLAQKDYEDSFIDYITDENGIINSVHFLGTLGEEKNEILMKSKVGVPNPLGRTETFCLSAVEMQLMGCSVAAMEAPGYFDTLYNGYMVKDKKQLEDAIVKLLLADAPIDYDSTVEYMKTNFSVEVVVAQWEQLLKSDLKHRINSIYPIKNLLYRSKWLKELLRIVKNICPPLFKLRYNVETHLYIWFNEQEAYRFI